VSESPEQRLMAAGMSPREAARKGGLFQRAARALELLGRGSTGPTRAYFVPGRIEFMGKHTDYAGGRSLVCATERGFCLVARARSDSGLRVVDAASDATASLALSPDLEVPRGRWSTYPATVARRLARDFPGLSVGVDLAFESDLPPAAGISSSSALVVGTFLALADANRMGDRADYRAALPDLVALAGYLGALENGRAFGSFAADQGAGIHGGSQDQTAILCAVPGALVQCGFEPVRLERTVPFPAGQVLAVGVSGVVAEKSGAAREAYNAAAAATAELLLRWRQGSGRDDSSLAAALRSAPDALARLADLVAAEPALRARLEQFESESEQLIPAAGDALARGDLPALGPLVDASQAGAERGLENQIPETVHLQRSARRLGAAAASAFGAGFGGSVWAMVEAGGSERFLREWGEDYRRAFPSLAEAARFFTTRPGPAALGW
jgi:galactokinase